LNYHAIIPSGKANSLSWHNSLTVHLKGFTSTYCCLYSHVHFRRWVPLQKYDSLKHIHCTSQNKGYGTFFNTLQTTELNDNSSILSPPPTFHLSPPSHHCHLSPNPFSPTSPLTPALSAEAERISKDIAGSDIVKLKVS